MNEHAPVYFVRIGNDGRPELIDPGATTEQEWIERAPLRQPLLRQLDRRIVACRRHQPRERSRR